MADYKLDFTTFHNVINNKLTTTASTRHAIDPSTEKALPEVPLSTAEDVEAAVAAGKAAFPAWSALSWDERADYLLKLADAFEAHGPSFVEMLVKEVGKAQSTAGFEVMVLVLDHLRRTAKLRIPDEVVEDSEERTAILRYRPLGVGAAIVPWNFPLALGVGKIGPALLAGNTLIVKPSPYTPYCTLKLVELAAQILPPGVLQVLSGDESLGPLLTEHPGIAKISFTGSLATGRKVMAACAGTLKRVTLELGGNDAAVVCADADVDAVVPKIATFCFLNSGQICMNIKRVYVHASIYDRFRDAFVAFTRDNLKAGPASDPSVTVGPLQNRMQFEKVRDNYFSKIASEGWKVLLGGSVPDAGLVLPPTVVDNPPESSRIVRDEPFGPIVPLLKWEDEADVVRRVNDSDFGLGASVWSSNVPRAQEIAKQLEAGSIWVNTHFEVAAHMPFGGHKLSGLGMEWGSVGLKGWCNPQAFWTRHK